MAGFPLTQPSIPLILTGRFFDDSKPYDEFIKSVYEEESLPKKLRTDGYRVEVYPKFTNRTVSYDPRVISNLKRRKGGSSFTNNLYLMDVTLFRCLPHFLKAFVYNDNRWLLVRCRAWKRHGVSTEGASAASCGQWEDCDRQRIDRLVAEMRADARQPVFKFIHLFGGHVPYQFDANGGRRKPKQSRPAYKDQLIFKWKLVCRFLEKFKKLALYNQSLILIMGDHGAGRSPDNAFDARWLGFDRDESRRRVCDLVKVRALPALLIKPIQSKGPLRVSDAPVSLADVEAIVLRLLRASKEEADALLETGLNHERQPRRYLYFGFRTMDVDYLPELFEYHITGPAWINRSWSGPVRIYTAGGTYRLVHTVRFMAPSVAGEKSSKKREHQAALLAWLGGDRCYPVTVPDANATHKLRVVGLAARGFVPEQYEITFSEKSNFTGTTVMSFCFDHSGPSYVVNVKQHGKVISRWRLRSVAEPPLEEVRFYEQQGPPSL